MVSRAGLLNQDLEFVQFHPTGNKFFFNALVRFMNLFLVDKNSCVIKSFFFIFVL